MTDQPPDQLGEPTPGDSASPASEGTTESLAPPAEQPFGEGSPIPPPPPAGEPGYGAPPAGGPGYGAPPDPGAYGAAPFDPYAGQPYAGAPAFDPYAGQPYPSPQMAWPAPGAPCHACGQPLGVTVACLYCKQVANMPPGYRLSSVGERLGQYLLDLVLFVVTLAIGYIIWSVIIWGRGQTPAMQLLKMRCARKDTGQIAGLGTMALREIIGKWLLFDVISAVFLPAAIILYFMLLWDKDRQQLWDKIATTIVVDDPVMVPPPVTPAF